MMNEQHDLTSEQPNEGLTTEDIVAAARRKDEEPDTRQTGVSEPARPQPARSTASSAPRDADAARDQQPQGNVTSKTAPAPRESLDRRGAGAEPGAAPARAAEQQGRVGAALMPLLSDDATDAFQARWDAIQTAFVDDPRQVVEQADTLVAEVMQRLAETFAQERAILERQWARGSDVSTEDLRLALQRYRSFFQRLLSA